MDNETDIIEIIKQAVEECQVEIATEHLLKGIVPQRDCETPYILVTKPSDNELILSPDSEANTSKGSSLGGSPLKLKNYYVGKDSGTISKSGVAYKACTIHEARKILSVYQLESQSSSVSRPILPLWVLCDKNDPQGTVALSSHVRKRQQDIYTFNSHVVTIKGPFTENDVTSELNTVLKYISHGADENSQRLDINCSAIYTVFGALGSKDVSADQIQTASSTMSIHLTWNKFSTTLVPPRDARAKVAVTVVAGDERSAAISRYRELMVLLELIKGVEKNEVHWSAECTDAAPLQRISKLLEDMKSGNQGLPSEEGDGSDSPTPAALSTLQRKDLDFTEELWTILKDCTSNRELIECFKYIFNCLNSAQIQPMVHRTNKTILAELVRDSFQRNMVIPSLEGAGAVNILIDMGIEKLTRDYIGTFIGKELVTLNHLSFFMTSNKKLSFAQRAERLERLHYVLELVVLLDQFVNVQHPTLSMCSRQALEYYEQHQVEPHHEFNIPLQTNLVSGYIEK